MGAFPETLLLVQETTENEFIWKQTSMEEEEEEEEAINKAKAKAKSFNGIRRRRSSSSNSSTKKRRSRSLSRIEQGVSTLRNLVPNMNGHDDDDNEGSVGSLEQLFTQTADYISSLQTKVRLMKALVDVLSGSSSSNDHE